ncbi:MAG: ribbon-helix-helix protein, CopG family [Eubacteriales bacterium]|nr:ribbon-helix-helix protein, CopG family [Eubacteriales bacterium]
MAEPKKVLLHLSDKLIDAADEYAKEDGISRSGLIRKALRLYLEKRDYEKLEEQMKKGYQLMGKINLEEAEFALEADNRQYLSYEEKLSECE